MTRRRLDFTGRAGRRSDGQTGLRVSAAVDFALLLFFLTLAQGSAAQGEGARTDPASPLGPVPPVVLSPRESLRVEPGAASGDSIHFSQIDAPAGGAPFVLPQAPVAGVAQPVAAVVPVAADHATTVRFDVDYRAGRAAVLFAMEDPEADAVAGQLDHAQFLIAHMMLAEARGVLAALRTAEPLDPADQDRAEGYAAILSRLAGGSPDTLPAAWSDDPLWPVIVEGQPVTEPRLRAALSALSVQSRAVATAALPILFDLALAGNAVGLAAEMLAAAPAGTDLDGTAQLDLMRGRLALAQGGEDLAFDTFARLAEGTDVHAAEARIALAEMALSRKDPSLLPEVARLLQEGLPRWRGDATALRLRVRLARVAEDLGNLPLAVEVMAMIAQEHPGTPEAELAATRLPVMVGHLADAVRADAMPLAEALATVRRLDPALAGQGAWVTARAAVAARLRDAGLSAAAQAEYAAIGRMPHATLQSAAPAVLDAVALRHAAVLLDRGASAEAVAVLDRHAYPRRADAMPQHAALRLRAGQTAILPDLLLGALKVADPADLPAAEVQLALAEAAVRTGQPDAALAAMDHALPLADAALRLRVARMAADEGEAARATRLAGPAEGPRSEAAQGLLAGLAAPRRSGERLSVTNAGALITDAETAGAAVEALLADVPPP